MPSDVIQHCICMHYACTEKGCGYHTIGGMSRIHNMSRTSTSRGLSVYSMTALLCSVCSQVCVRVLLLPELALNLDHGHHLFGSKCTTQATSPMQNRKERSSLGKWLRKTSEQSQTPLKKLCSRNTGNTAWKCLELQVDGAEEGGKPQIKMRSRLLKHSRSLRLLRLERRRKQ